MDAGQMMPPAPPWLKLVAVGIPALIIGYLAVELHQERKAHLEQAFRADSIGAALDTTRAVNARAQKVLGDSIRGVELRAIQLVAIKVDALDEAVGRISVAKAKATTTVTPIVDVVRTATVTTDTAKDERKATFLVDSTPYHAKAEVALPRIGAGRIGLSIRTDTAHVGARYQCGKAKDGGVRPASILLTGPPWLPFTIDSAQVDQNGCNPARPSTPLWVKVLWGTGGVGLGWLAFH
jgi:hypothetical protein